MLKVAASIPEHQKLQRLQTLTESRVESHFTMDIVQRFEVQWSFEDAQHGIILLSFGGILRSAPCCIFDSPYQLGCCSSAFDVP